MQDFERKYALVTGAAHGLGKAFATELSRKQINTILVDLPDSGLVSLCQDLMRENGGDSVSYECDLTDKDNVVELASTVNNRFQVFMLINNAGIGGSRRFDRVDVDYINRMIQLNVMAPSILTHQLLPNLQRQRQGYILNISSLAAFSPMAFKTAYPASKVFIYYFSRGLCQELKDSNVFVSTVFPGPMRTNPEVTNRIDSHGYFGKLGLMVPEKVARISLQRLFKKNPLILLNNGVFLHYLLMRIIPLSIRLRLLARTFRKEADLGDHEPSSLQLSL